MQFICFKCILYTRVKNWYHTDRNGRKDYVYDALFKGAGDNTC